MEDEFNITTYLRELRQRYLEANGKYPGEQQHYIDALKLRPDGEEHDLHISEYHHHIMEYCHG